VEFDLEIPKKSFYEKLFLKKILMTNLCLCFLQKGYGQRLTTMFNLIRREVLKVEYFKKTKIQFFHYVKEKYVCLKNFKSQIFVLEKKKLDHLLLDIQVGGIVMNVKAK